MARGIGVAVAAGLLWFGLPAAWADPGAPVPSAAGVAAPRPGLPPPSVRNVAGSDGLLGDRVPPPADAPVGQVQAGAPAVVLATRSPDGAFAPAPAVIRPVSAYLKPTVPAPRIAAVPRRDPAPLLAAAAPHPQPAAPAPRHVATSSHVPAATQAPEVVPARIEKPTVAGLRVPPAAPPATLERPASSVASVPAAVVPTARTGAARSGVGAASLGKTAARPPKRDSGDCKT